MLPTKFTTIPVHLVAYMVSTLSVSSYRFPCHTYIKYLLAL
nr:MAG TPA: hypothetical protein [Inoviridae sp.]